jgi:hypothetical protein
MPLVLTADVALMVAVPLPLSVNVMPLAAPYLTH